jgi:hypothetical protein
MIATAPLSARAKDWPGKMEVRICRPVRSSKIVNIDSVRISPWRSLQRYYDDSTEAL